MRFGRTTLCCNGDRGVSSLLVYEEMGQGCISLWGIQPRVLVGG